MRARRVLTDIISRKQRINALCVQRIVSLALAQLQIVSHAHLIDSFT